MTGLGLFTTASHLEKSPVSSDYPRNGHLEGFLVVSRTKFEGIFSLNMESELEMRRIKGLLIDLDGVLVKGKAMKPFPDAADFVALLRDEHIPFRIVTNNSTKTPEGIVRRLQENGIPILSQEIVSPLSICPQVLQERGVETLFVMGSDGLKEYLAANGFLVKTEATVDAVLVAQDRTLSFQETKIAITAIKSHGAALFAMNDNRVILDDDGMVFPGAGAICRMLIYAADYEGHYVHFGKMGERYNQTVFEEFHQDKATLAIISDDLYTDITGFQEEGLMGIFITSGKYGVDDISTGMKPDAIFDSLSEVAVFLINR